jgi:hypothetical protein
MLLPLAAHKETECLSISVSNRTAHLLYRYCTNCTTRHLSVLTVITQKLLLPDQLHNRRENVKPISSGVECSGGLKLSVYIGNRIERLEPSNSHYWLKAKSHYFYSDKEQLEVAKIIKAMCKLKVNSLLSLSSFDLYEYF